MSKLGKLTRFALSYLGINPDVFWVNVSQFGSFLSDRRRFRSSFRKQYQSWAWKEYPILTDKKEQSGKARGQYFYQDLFVAQKIFEANPLRHIDVGSRVDGFVAHLASFRQVDVLDIRPLENRISNITFHQADLMMTLEKFLESTDSLSCLHTIEHFGLGRYGDTVDVDGHLKGLDSLYSMLKPDGVFYFSTQIGPSRVEFNAHRVFSVAYLLDLFRNKYQLLEFAYIDDSDVLHTHVEMDEKAVKANFGCKMGCGIFILKKL